jgi:hypothetical protein
MFKAQSLNRRTLVFRGCAISGNTSKGCVHFWPFDGWDVPPNCSVVAEVYPALWTRTFPSEGRTPDQQDAFAIAKWLQAADCVGSLKKYFRPRLEPDERKKAEVEGWILGVL